MRIELLDWDSVFFGVKVGRLTLSRDADWNKADLKNWDLVYIYVEPADAAHNSLLQERGVLLADEKVTYLMNIPVEATNLDSHIQSYFSSEKDDQVINIGIQSGLYSRFNIDPKIGREKFEELYRIWMKRSISRDIAKEVLVYKIDNEIAGVVTLGEKNNRADISLIAVDNSFRGQNIGRKLIQAAINYAANNQYSFLQVVTQSVNKGACKFYEQCGFKKENIINVYHFWN